MVDNHEMCGIVDNAMGKKSKTGFYIILAMLAFMAVCLGAIVTCVDCSDHASAAQQCDCACHVESILLQGHGGVSIQAAHEPYADFFRIPPTAPTADIDRPPQIV